MSDQEPSGEIGISNRNQEKINKLKDKTQHPELVSKYVNQSIPEDVARRLAARDLLLERARKRNKELEELALKDTLTRLSRRDIAIPDIEHQIDLFKKGEVNTIIIGLTDIDYFSRWNDLFRSHKLGDQGLIGFAEILKEILREEDMVSRFGGEEFVIRLSVEKNLTPEEAEKLAERISVELGKKVMETLLDRVLVDNILNGQRRVKIDKWDENGNRLSEREGTVVLREYAKNFLQMRSNEDEVESVVMNGKGSEEEKKELLKIIQSIDLSYYEEYLSDERVIDEFQIDKDNPDSEDAQKLSRRREIERKLIDDIRRVLKTGTCSSGFLVLTPEDRDEVNSADQLKSIADSLMYQAKSSGRNRVALQVGTEGKQPKIIPIEGKENQLSPGTSSTEPTTNSPSP